MPSRNTVVHTKRSSAGPFLSFWTLLAFTALVVTPTWGLVIYRFGGENLPPPPEEDSTGVEVIRLAWDDLDPDLGGEAIELALARERIGALERDPDFNIAPTIQQFGGDYLRPHVNATVFDGDTSTVWYAQRYLCAEFSETNYFIRCSDDFGTPGTANIELGSEYQIDRIRVISGLRDAGRTVEKLRIHLGEGLPPMQVYLHPWPIDPWLLEVRDNRQQYLEIDIPSSEESRFVQITIGEHNTDWEVHEIEIYARGFVERSTYISNIVSFDRPMAWGDVRWSGSKGDLADVYIQTRTGLDPTPDVYFRYTGRGDEKEEVTADEYDGLGVGEKAGIGYDQQNWSFWSAPYNFGDNSGVPVASPSPREHFQFKVDFLPRDDEGGELEFLELRASEPVATALVGEVWPIESEVGKLQPFTYVLKPTLLGEDGFDRFEIRSLSLLGKVLAVRIGDEEQPLDVVVEEEHRLVVSLRRLGSLDSGTPVEIDFEAQVLRYGATFDGRVWDSERQLEVPQGILPGDATGEYEGNRVSVATSVKEQSLLQVTVPNPVLTPNGDGINDTAALVYEILEITGTAAVEVGIWDLSGRRVKGLHEGAQGIGRYPLSWDGTDDGQSLLPPGVYLFRVSVTADRANVDKVGLLHVAY